MVKCNGNAICGKWQWECHAQQPLCGLRDTQQWPRNGSAVLFDVLRVDLHTIVSCSFILFYDHGFRGHSKITDILYASVFGSFGDIYPGQKDTKSLETHSYVIIWAHCVWLNANAPTRPASSPHRICEEEEEEKNKRKSIDPDSACLLFVYHHAL